jgi:hypothetical protein
MPWTNVTDAIGAANRALGLTSDEITGKLDPAVTAAAVSAGEAAGEFDALNDAANDVAAGMQQTATRAGWLKESQESAARAAQKHADDLDRLSGALTENGDSFQDAADAQIEMTDAQARAIEVSKDQEASVEDVRDAAIDAAKATADFGTKQALTAGKVQSSTEKLDGMNGALIDQAARLNGPARNAVLDYIGNLNGIPPEKVSEIKANLDNGAVSHAKDVLAGASAPRTAYINAQAITDGARRDLDNLTATRSVRIIANQVVAGARAAGGPVKAGQPYLVGEEGPEIVVPGKSGTVIPNDVAARGSGSPLVAAGTGGPVYSITVNAGMGTNGPSVANEIVKYIKEYERRNGPGWRS